MTITKSKPKTQLSPFQKKIENYTKIPNIIGIPPMTGSQIDVTTNLIMNSSLVLYITPCKAKFEKGISLFSLESDWGYYKKLLNDHTFCPDSAHESSQSIFVSFQTESFPTDTFTNEYGEHFLNKLTDTAGSAFGEFSQMMGKQNLTEATREFGHALESTDGALLGTIGSSIRGAGDLLTGFKQSAESSKNEVVRGMANMADRLMAGARIDFPMVWKNSSYSPTFSITIRLWNPHPGNEKATNQYIIAPLAALLILGLPRTDEGQSDSSSYSWPFLCKINCPGLFNIHAGAVTNISVTKGGEGGHVAFNQRLGLVDVRMDFINLHNSMIISNFGGYQRPTLGGYLQNLKDSSKLEKIYKDEDYSLSKNKLIISKKSKKNTVLSQKITTDTVSPPPSRVDQLQKIEGEKILDSLPTII